MSTVRMELRNASKSVGTRAQRRRLWSNVNFSMSAGECVGVAGHSGCGKSTLLNCVGLLEHFDSGKLFIDGVDVSNTSARTRMRYRRQSIGYLF